MRLLIGLGGPRTVGAVLTGVTALYLALVVFNNLTDFGTNHAFVQHVFAMDTTFKSPNTMWRAITSPALVNIAYVLIIAWEAATAIVLVIATVSWVRADVEVARRISGLGLSMQLLLFGGGFIAIGGEWFCMWQSKQWNGLQAALQNVIIGGLVLIVTQVAGRVRAAVPPAA
ncbi:DUF2165 domain-containing protein [Crossiella sp. SN42]|uniref:DUF2165 domain-containing protein n=1 Tax=Crossiella sp. SN42 TaxID=2944808 RepID=UPI00207C3862|nr:DUF2165 domain-containing protein [Crossiella sp. SN42]MCO1581039.1 DUF2165 domain-containing protein [Crossiella sp. SN42]